MLQKEDKTGKMNKHNACWVFLEMGVFGTDEEGSTTWPLHLLLSCILATKPVRGICGVSWGMGGGGATDTESTAERRRERERESESSSVKSTSIPSSSVSVNTSNRTR